MPDPITYKGCLLCGAIVPSDTVTCPNDGEASWAPTAPTAPVPDTSPDATAATDAAVDPTAPVKRGKKS